MDALSRYLLVSLLVTHRNQYADRSLSNCVRAAAYTPHAMSRLTTKSLLIPQYLISACDRPSTTTQRDRSLEEYAFPKPPKASQTVPAPPPKNLAHGTNRQSHRDIYLSKRGFSHLPLKIFHLGHLYLLGARSMLKMIGSTLFPNVLRRSPFTDCFF